MRDLLREVGLVACGGNYESVRRRLLTLGLLEDKFCPQPSRGPSRDAITDGPRRPLSDLLVRGRFVGSSFLRRRMLAEGLLPRRCSSCLLTEWQGQPVPLELDHVSGDRYDNRLENLRLLCPNCHAQTPTYRGRNIGKGRRPDAG